METDGFTITAQAADVDCATGVLSWQPNGRNLYVAQALGGPAAGEGPAARPPLPDWVRAVEERTGPDASGISPASYPESNSARHTNTIPTLPDELATTSSAARAAVVLYETNGLPHGGFWVGPRVGAGEPTLVVDMAWSPDSQLLAVVVASTSSASSSCVQLWRRSNWHWYCMFEWQEQGVARLGWGGGTGCVLQCLVDGLLVQVRAAGVGVGGAEVLRNALRWC